MVASGPSVAIAASSVPGKVGMEGVCSNYGTVQVNISRPHRSGAAVAARAAAC